MSPSISRRRGLQTMGLALIAATGLSACGGESSDDDSGSSGGLTELTVIRSTGASFEPLIIAQDQGFFTENGLDVTLLEAASGGAPTTVPRILKDEAQIGTADVAVLASAMAEGLAVKGVMTVQLSNDTDPVSDGLLTTEGSSVQTYADLAGKKVGLSALGGFPQAFVTIGATAAGVDPDDIQWVQLPTASLVDSVKKGTVDAIVSFASYYDAAIADGLVAVGNGSNDVPGVPQTLYFSTSAWASENADTLEKFRAAMNQAFDYANDNPDAVRTVDTDYTDLDADYIASRTIQAFGGEPDDDAIQSVLDALSNVGEITDAPAATDLFVDGS